VAVAVALVSFVLLILIWLVAQMAAVRFAKMESLREAFNIPAVLAQIQRLGWGAVGDEKYPLFRRPAGYGGTTGA
jgi:hypothetical protein